MIRSSPQSLGGIGVHRPKNEVICRVQRPVRQRAQEHATASGNPFRPDAANRVPRTPVIGERNCATLGNGVSAPNLPGLTSSHMRCFCSCEEQISKLELIQELNGDGRSPVTWGSFSNPSWWVPQVKKTLQYYAAVLQLCEQRGPK